jgi:hypothetical protein
MVLLRRISEKDFQKMGLLGQEYVPGCPSVTTPEPLNRFLLNLVLRTAINLSTHSVLIRDGKQYRVLHMNLKANTRTPRTVTSFTRFIRCITLRQPLTVYCYPI